MKNQTPYIWLPAILAAFILIISAWPAEQAAAQPALNGRLVIKTGRLGVMVPDTDAAVAAALDLGTTFNSYVLEQRVWDGRDRRYRYAEITFGLDEADFEGLLRALKTLGVVLNQSIDGQDVTDEQLDLSSRLTNLYATQSRLRSFLDQSRNVTETLRVHQELVEIEEEIGVVQGRINFLTDRSDAATITLNLTPFRPTPTVSPSPTATPTATPTPLPTAQVWRPRDTAKIATVHLQDTAQGVADVLIYRTIICGPWLLMAVFAFFAGRRFWRRRPPAPAEPAPPSPEPAPPAPETQEVEEVVSEE